MSGSISVAAGGDTASPRAPFSLKAHRRATNGEPLARFGEAKKVLGDIYGDLNSAVGDLSQFYNELCEDPDSEVSKVSSGQRADLEELASSIRIILETFHRDHMKVVFFGRTSNGKSTTINAMLHDKVLPQGMGHTTCCFLQVEGCSDDVGFLRRDEGTEKLPMSELRSYGHALGDQSPLPPAGGYNRTLRVFHPRVSAEGHTNRLLQNDVVIVDSPGVDVSPEFDSWIDTHCLDADVFVLVSNAESTLTQAEKAFFHRVSQKLSKPNIFVLNNRWDASASDGQETASQVRKQHEQRLRQFLIDELHVCTDKEVNDRIFFVSSRETLEARLKELGKLSSSPYQQEGFQERRTEFERFENKFEQCISRSAIQTKLEAHNRRALEIVGRMRDNVDTVQRVSGAQKGEMLQRLEESTSSFKECREQFARFEQAYKLQTDRLRAEVHLKVSADFSEEIQRLDSVIDKFNRTFVDDDKEIAEYKRELSKFVDEYLTQDLEARCTGGLMTRIWNIENSMFQCVKSLLPEEYQGKLEEVWRYRAPFKFQICVNVPQLTGDFHEDLEFRFSFGLSALIRRLVAYRTGQPVTAIRSNLLSFKSGAIETSAGASDADKQKAEAEAAMMSQMVMTSAAYLANGSVGVLVVAGIVYKAVGWKVIAGAGLIYGGLYSYERLRWNSSAKEGHLKAQFRTHLGTRMANVAAAHTTHCETQASREMEQVYEGLRATVGGVHAAMKEDCDGQRAKIDHVDKTLKGLGAIKGKTAFVLSNLESFANSFLRSDSPTS